MPKSLKDHILQTASEMFYQQGIRATGIDAIVKAAGTTKMSLYHYFPSKNDLALAHLQNSAEIMHETILTAIEARATEPEARMLAVFDVFAELMAANDFRGCPFINAVTETANCDNPLARFAADFYNNFRLSLAALATAAGFREPETLAQQWVLLISGAIIAEQMQHESGALAAAKQAAAILLMHYPRAKANA